MDRDDAGRLATALQIEAEHRFAGMPDIPAFRTEAGIIRFRLVC